MSRGRRPLGPRLVEGLEASTEARLRLKIVLETIAGERTVSEACEALGIGEARFHEMRRQALVGALEGLEPRAAGRPPRQASSGEPSYSELSSEVRELRIELRAAQVREEIRAAMPHLLLAGKKTRSTPGNWPSEKPYDPGATGRSSGKKKRT